MQVVCIVGHLEVRICQSSDRDKVEISIFDNVEKIASTEEDKDFFFRSVSLITGKH